MKRMVLCLGIVFASWSCERIQTGEAPIFEGFSAESTSQSQIQIFWSPGSDDTLDPYELRYSIWFEEGDDVMLDSENDTPNITTEKGALSYNLAGLKADTTYTILVRANEFGVYSENTASREVATLSADEDDYAALESMSLSSTPSGMVTRGDQVGFIFDDRLAFFPVDDFNTSIIANAGEAIVEAHIASTPGDSHPDVFILTETALELHLFVQNNLGLDNFSKSNANFIPVPVTGSFSFTTDGGTLDTLSYIGSDNIGYIYGYTEPAEGETPENQGFGTAFTYDLDGAGSFRLGHLNGGELYDLVSFVDGELGVALGSDEGFEFDSLEVIDSVGSGEIGSGSFNAGVTDVSLFLHDGDSDEDLDIYLYFRRAGQNVSKLWRYEGQGDGNFSGRTEVDFEMAFYEDPQFQDADNDGMPDLVLRQTSSNNVAVFIAPSFSKNSPGLYGPGGDEAPDLVTVGDVTGDNKADVLMVRERNLFLLLTK